MSGLAQVIIKDYPVYVDLISKKEDINSEEVINDMITKINKYSEREQ